MTHDEVLACIKQEKLVAILRGVPMDRIDGVVGALVRGGVRILEFTFDHAEPDCVAGNAAKIRRTVEQFGDQVLVGCGTTLTVQEVEAAHEARLAPRCRIDFLAGGIGIEIKKKRPERAKLIAQLARYAACPQVRALIVVAPRGVNLPRQIGGKPVTMLALERLWGISLP